MDRSFRQTLIAIAAVLMLAAFSVVSASLMAPDRSDAGMEQMLAMGATVDDLCAVDGHGHHDHDCPFCHKLPTPPQAQAPDRAHPAVYSVASDTGRDLVSGPQYTLSHVSVRAPPRLI
ncbi:hypothetical protein [Chachezhania sediminis]|uniref:hypothetical protein n=1 Tax=Chachezhania sediminis TaxID=2599291 RepID=UPI00131B24BA|nr:hypothetical protein [Chachezhania sediminis]